MATIGEEILEDLMFAGNGERRSVARNLIEEIQNGDAVKGAGAYSSLAAAVRGYIVPGDLSDAPEVFHCEQVVTQERMPGTRFFDTTTTIGLISPEVPTPRTSSFVQGVMSHTPEGGSVVEVGCGAGALLSVAAAVAGAESVRAYEINPASVVCAREMVEVFGFDGVIDVVDGNYLDLLPDEDSGTVDLGVSETFGEALMREPALDVYPELAQRSERIFPAKVEVHARFKDKQPLPWTTVQEINLASGATIIEGELDMVRTSSQLQIAATHQDDAGNTVIPLGRDAITMPQSVRVDQFVAGTTVSFSYHTGGKYNGVWVR